MEKLLFETEDGEKAEFEVLEQTRVNGRNYLLVADDNDEAYIMKDMSSDEAAEACYEFLEDEKEYDAVYEVFRNLLEDIDFE